MKPKILILGKGYIGRRIAQETGWPVSGKRIRSYKNLQQELAKYKADVVINCIGHVGRNSVDDCENNIEGSLLANTMIPIWLGELAYQQNIKLVHIDSGCIYHFDYARQKPITEEMAPDYYNLFYSRTKIYAENVLGPLSQKANILCLRLRIPLDIYPHPRNLLTKLIKYKRVISSPNSVTYIPDFIQALQVLVKSDTRGIYNVVAKGALSYPKLMDIYKKYRPEFKYRTITMKDLKFERTNLLLSVKKLEKAGVKVRSIQEILEECVFHYVNY